MSLFFYGSFFFLFFFLIIEVLINFGMKFCFEKIQSRTSSYNMEILSIRVKEDPFYVNGSVL